MGNAETLRPFTPDIPPRRVLLFSGHRVDAPGRTPPRFGADLVDAAEARIDAAIAGLDAGPPDLALTQGAAGGDILFAEACRHRGVRVQLLLPLAEPAFIAASILTSENGDRWLERYGDLKRRLADPPLAAPAWLGDLGPGDDPFERGNRWLLASALAAASGPLHFICLWDGGSGDGPGGTRHMVEAVRASGGDVIRIDPRTLRPASPC